MLLRSTEGGSLCKEKEDGGDGGELWARIDEEGRAETLRKKDSEARRRIPCSKRDDAVVGREGPVAKVSLTAMGREERRWVELGGRVDEDSSGGKKIDCDEEVLDVS